jgi:hypothetical protein
VSEPSPSLGRRWWPQLRALAVTCAIIVGLTDGCPMPSAARRGRLAPSVASFLVEVEKVRAAILKPLDPLWHRVFIGQRWALFRAASRHQNRMWIEARAGRDAPWAVLFRVQDDDYAFMASRISYRRLRGSWDPRTSGPRGAWKPFVTWIAGQIFASDPHLTEVRVRMEKAEIGARGGVTMTGEFEYDQTRQRPAP